MMFRQRILQFILSFLSVAAIGQHGWSPIRDIGTVKGLRQIVPEKFSAFNVDPDLLQALKNAPDEGSPSGTKCIVTLPTPDGRFKQFEAFENNVMPADLKNGFPMLRTYSLRGTDKQSSGTLQRDVYGIHASVFSASGDYFIDPVTTESPDKIIAYFVHDFIKPAEHRISSEETFRIEALNATSGVQFRQMAPACIGDQLKTYKLAIACTGEYAIAATGNSNPSLAQTLSMILVTVSRVSGVYEKELGVRLQLVSTSTNVIFTIPSTDPFTGNNVANTLLAESQTVINSNIGAGNYDIGHTFSTNAGGLATVGVVCKDAHKAKGVTGLPKPVGDPYDIDFVAHEIGHQFNGGHTFNAITGNCNGQRDPVSASEPGSGITIMGYAGICSVNDLAPNSIPFFHTISFDQITAYVNSSSGGCGVTSTTGNKPPVVSSPPAHIVPKRTPYVLTGSATDPDGDALTYSWEESDIAFSQGNWNSDLKPYFRSYPPVNTPTRSFPAAHLVLAGDYANTRGEFLTPTPQTLSFRLTARDNRTGGGGVCYSETKVNIADVGPFSVTYPTNPGIGWPVNSIRKIQWAVNNTDKSPVNCDSVRISLSFNSGASYSVIAATTPNDGEFDFNVPNINAVISTCRVKIEARNNIFYDVGDNDFVISTDPNVGLSESPENISVKIWPVPNSDELFFELPEQFYNSKATICDVLGKTVLQFKCEKNQQVINTKELAPGVYFLHIYFGNRLESKMFIKN